ncbi:MAG: hypothetical protein ACR2QG_03935 [Gammaproteobacteria bacterium]
MNSDDFYQEAGSVAEQKIAALKKLSFAEAADLPGAVLDDIVVGSKEVQMTVFKQQGIHALGDSILITVQLTRAGLGGVINYQLEKGLVFFPDGEVRDATEQELQDTGG